MLGKILKIQDKEYKIIKLLGEGSHSKVWEAKCLSDKSEENKAIKISKDKYGIGVERLKNEIEFLRSVSHKNIPVIYDTGEIDKYLWIALPKYNLLSIQFPSENGDIIFYLNNIEDYQKNLKKISLRYREEITIKIILDISDIILYISQVGIIHGDISLTNIMEKGDYLNKNYFLIDWGASALIKKYPKETFGSLNFTAPERILGEISIKSDIFSLGIVGFYILTSRIPYVGDTLEDYYKSIIDRDGIKPSFFIKNVDRELDKLIGYLIRKKIEKRIDIYKLRVQIEKIAKKRGIEYEKNN